MLTIQFGQCGNQLGHRLFSLLSSDIDVRDKSSTLEANYQYAESAFEKWFEGITKEGKRVARVILVDTEQKVLKSICRQTDFKWSYRPQNVICQAGGGSANNWAYGYFIKGPQLKEDALDAVRKEIERADRLEGILLLLSSAGGTGSGVGSHIIELLREELLTKTFIGATILPFTSGEVVTQNYNTLLTIAKLGEFCDTDLLFENEQIHSICTNVLKHINAQFDDINEIISRKLSAIFQPVEAVNINANTLASLIAPHPSYKLASVKSAPYIASTCTAYECSYKWDSYIRHLKQNLRLSSLSHEPVDAEIKKIPHAQSDRVSFKYCRSVSNIIITRGTSISNDPIVCDEMKKKDLYVDWISEPTKFTHFNQERRLLNQEKFAALVTNNSQIHRPLNTIVDKAWEMYTHAAFLHQYTKFGLEEDDFLHAFAKVENIVKTYKELEIK